MWEPYQAPVSKQGVQVVPHPQMAPGPPREDTPNRLQKLLLLLC